MQKCKKKRASLSVAMPVITDCPVKARAALKKWQESHAVSDSEAADILGLTYHTYKGYVDAKSATPYHVPLMAFYFDKVLDLAAALKRVEKAIGAKALHSLLSSPPGAGDYGDLPIRPGQYGLGL